MSKKHVLLAVCSCLFFLSFFLVFPSEGLCAQSRIEGAPIAGTLTVTVLRGDVETPTPLEGAFVMVGGEPDNPFAGNYGFTDAQGTLTLAAPELVGPQTVTAGAEGYQYVSLVDVNADSLTVALPLLRDVDSEGSQGASLVDVTGAVTDFLVDNGPLEAGDGWLDAGFVCPVLDVEEVLNLDLGTLMVGGESFQIGGDANVEGSLSENVVLPAQYEFSTWIERLQYRWQAQDQQETTLGCMAGRVGTQALLDWLTTGTSLTELLPQIELYKVGTSGSFLVSGPSSMIFTRPTA